MMHKLNEDCYYFLTTSCTKGATCLYRHNPLALKSNVICPAWIRGQCLDAACPLRHTNAAQRPIASNGIMCFYENMPTGCLKVDCTFIHTRPRVHLTNPSLVRPPSMNLINKEIPKPVSTSSVPPSVPTPVEPTTNETQTTATAQPDPSSPKRKAEIVVRRVALNTDNDVSTEKMTNPSESSTPSPTKVTARSVITNTPEEKPDETGNNANATRIVVNRTAVRPEPVSTPARKIVQATTSNRVVVASKPNTSSSSPAPASAPSSVLRVKRSTGKTDKLVEQENETKKFKADSSSITNNSTTNTRLLLLATKQITATEDEKTGPLKRSRLPAKKSTGGNVSVTVSISATEHKKSTGTGLVSQDDARRTSRLERFKSKPSSPPMANTTKPTNSALPSRNVVTLTVNGVKRAASVSITQNTPPAKRAPTKQQSAPIVNHAVAVKTSPSKATTTPSRPRFVPQPIRAPSPVSTNKIKSPPVMIKRPPTTNPTPSETSQKSVNDDKSTNTSVELVKTFNEERADPLLKVNESNNVVDTFALIDAALLEADHLLNLI